MGLTGGNPALHSWLCPPENMWISAKAIYSDLKKKNKEQEQKNIEHFCKSNGVGQAISDVSHWLSLFGVSQKGEQQGKHRKAEKWLLSIVSLLGGDAGGMWPPNMVSIPETL